MFRLFIENLAWTFNGTKFGDKCWGMYERLRERELRKIDRRRKRL